MFCYLYFPYGYFEANGQNHIYFRLIQVLKSSMAWHFLTFTSPSSKLEFVYPPCCGVEEQMLIFSSGLTPGRVKGSWIEIQSPSYASYSSYWKTPVCLKFGKICNRAVENLLRRTDSESGQRTMRTSPCLYLSCSWRNALWLNAMHCGKKCG